MLNMSMIYPINNIYINDIERARLIARADARVEQDRVEGMRDALLLAHGAERLEIVVEHVHGRARVRYPRMLQRLFSCRMARVERSPGPYAELIRYDITDAAAPRQLLQEPCASHTLLHNGCCSAAAAVAGIRQCGSL